MVLLRKFHLDDFPIEKIYIILKKEFRNRFFITLYDEIGGSVILSRQIKKGRYREVIWRVPDA